MVVVVICFMTVITGLYGSLLSVMSLAVCCRYSLTHIAVDWQVLSADFWSYDVLFIGTGYSITVSEYQLFITRVNLGMETVQVIPLRRTLASSP